MSLNKEYSSLMEKGVKRFVEHSDFNKATGHVTFKADKLELPKGVTEATMKTHVNFINEISSQIEVATAEIARTQFAEDDKLKTLDATLSWGDFTINSQHHLQQQVGEEYLYGMSTTAIDYLHSEDESLWLEQQRQSNVELATKLFG